MDELTSRKRQLAQLRANLLRIEFQKTTFIDPRSVSPDLAEAERRTREEIERIKQRLTEPGQGSDMMRGKLDEPCTIPFIVAAMTYEQAKQLKEGKVFRNNPNVTPAMKESFEAFKQALDDHGISDLSIYYGKQREAWKPYIPSLEPSPDDETENEAVESKTYPDDETKDEVIEPKPVHQIIYDVLDHINEYHRQPQNLPIISPQFLSKDFFDKNPHQRRSALTRLQQSGGIIIIDAISMFHPTLSRSIYNSDIGSNKRVATLVFSPLDTTAFEINRLIEQVINTEWETAFTRFDYDLDHLCEIGIGNLRAFKRWLSAILPQVATHAQKEKPTQANLTQLYQMRPEQPTGFDPVELMSQEGV